MKLINLMLQTIVQIFNYIICWSNTNWKWYMIVVRGLWLIYSMWIKNFVSQKLLQTRIKIYIVQDKKYITTQNINTITPKIFRLKPQKWFLKPVAISNYYLDGQQEFLFVTLIYLSKQSPTYIYTYTQMFFYYTHIYTHTFLFHKFFIYTHLTKKKRLVFSIKIMFDDNLS